MRRSPLVLKSTLAFSLLATLTACLDLPIQGEVSGQSMEWVATSVTLEDPLIVPLEGSAQNLAVAVPAPQVVLSDLAVGCDALDRLAEPGDGRHTLALTLSRGGKEIVPGEYRIGGGEGAAGTVMASFLSGGAERVVQEEAVSGVVVVDEATGRFLSGQIFLEFTTGKLSGYFNSSGCEDEASSAP